MQTWAGRIKKNPRDVEALKGLGEACYQAGKYAVASKCLQRALKLSPDDPLCLYYLGMMLEKQDLKPDALKLYSRYASAPAGPFRDKVEERYLVLRRESLKEEAAQLAAQESAIGAVRPAPGTIAVLPFRVESGDPQMFPVGKGLAEMLITDLGQIPSLKLVERVRVQSLFDEVKLGQTGLVDESEAARFGLMLSAGRVVRGGLTVDPSLKMRMEAVTLITSDEDAAPARPVTLSDAFKNLLRAEKDLAFKVLDRLGVDPTPAERRRILTVPTKNLQAFIAYCNGLDLEDKGQFQKAAAQYRKAIQLDPQYKSAQQKLRTASILARAVESGWRPSESRPRTADRLVQPLISPESLMHDRLNTVQTNLGSNFILGKDVRKTGEVPAESFMVPDLPEPPALPDVIP
ncbi:MAG: tetratricopeptide repeat protein [bacterium]|nr:tetratricopeptide repeat protein [bacterium]